MTTLDSRQIARDLVRALRGNRSQTALSRSLGFRSNVVYSWEHGRRFPEVSLFLQAAARTDPNIRQKLAGFFEESEERFSGRRVHSPRTVTYLVQRLVGSAPKTRIAAALSVDRTTLGRWFAGRSEPRLPEFLELIRATTQRLLHFVGLFASLPNLPSTKKTYEHLLRQEKLAFETPFSHAVLRALELNGYRALPKHDSAFIARQVGITVDDVNRYLTRLQEAGQVSLVGKHLEVTQIMTVDTREDPERNRQLKGYWAAEALTRFRSGRTGPETLFSFNLFAISEERYQRIRELHLAYYDQIRTIVEGSQSSDRVVLLNLQLVPLASPQGGPHAESDAPNLPLDRDEEVAK